MERNNNNENEIFARITCPYKRATIRELIVDIILDILFTLAKSADYKVQNLSIKLKISPIKNVIKQFFQKFFRTVLRAHGQLLRSNSQHMKKN